jgi:molybdopterin-containing oxidoreductase family membrane subunit
MHKESDIRLPLILGDKSYKDITDDVIRPIEAKPPKTWYLLLMISIVIALVGYRMYRLFARNWCWCLGVK